MADWEQTLNSWAKPASDTEDEKRDRTERMITDAIRKDFASTHVDVYAKGSYANNTNVRLDSDVDIAVEFTERFYFDATDGRNAQQLEIVPSPYPYMPAQFKDDVEATLVAKFGRAAITRGNKALHVCEKSSRLSADVVPCFTYKLYPRYDLIASLLGPQQPALGVKLFPDRGPPIINWPRQQAANSTRKNNETGRRYKRIVRMLKRLENDLVEQRRSPVVPSYLIECLVYNVANARIQDFLASLFGGGYHRSVRNVILDAYEMVKDDQRAASMVEVNGIKPLFFAEQPWMRQQAMGFLTRVWNELDLAQVS